MVLGLTGAIGSGKSAVLSEFAKRSWIISDADKLCHKVYENATDDFISGLKRLFGENCVYSEKKVDRKVIAESVFNDREKLQKLEELIYPEFEKIFQDFINNCRQNNMNTVCEIPLLFEKNYGKYFDAVIGIWTPESVRHQRLANFRKMSSEDISRREKNQFSAEKKIELADFCIVNDGTLDDVARQIDELLNNIIIGK